MSWINVNGDLREKICKTVTGYAELVGRVYCGVANIFQSVPCVCHSQRRLHFVPTLLSLHDKRFCIVISIILYKITTSYFFERWMTTDSRFIILLCFWCLCHFICVFTDIATVSVSSVCILVRCIAPENCVDNLSRALDISVLAFHTLDLFKYRVCIDTSSV